MRGVQCMCSVADDTIYNHIIVEKIKNYVFFIMLYIIYGFLYIKHICRLVCRFTQEYDRIT